VYFGGKEEKRGGGGRKERGRRLHCKSFVIYSFQYRRGDGKGRKEALKKKQSTL